MELINNFSLLLITFLSLWLVAQLFAYLLRRKIAKLRRLNQTAGTNHKIASHANNFLKQKKLSSVSDLIILNSLLVLLFGLLGYYFSPVFNSLLPIEQLDFLQTPFIKNFLVPIFWAVLLANLMALGFYQMAQYNLPAIRVLDFLAKSLMVIGTGLTLLISFGIIATLIWETLIFFQKIPFTNFFFNLVWDSSSNNFGVLPLFLGTLVISAIALLLAVPIGLMAAIYLSDYARPGLAAWLKPLLEILAGIPTVVYGFFAIVVISPAIKVFFEFFGLAVSLENALAAGIIMGVMIIPIISSFSQDVISAVPLQLREASLALGATPSETIKRVVLPYAKSGIYSAVLLGISRAIGETMIVVMAAGLSAKLSLNPLDALTTITVQIVMALTGDTEFDNPKALSAYALGFLLFAVTLIINWLALKLRGQKPE